MFLPCRICPWVAMTLCTGVWARTWYVDQGHPNASETADGLSTQPMRTISRAAAQAGPGDVVMIANGVYREHVSPATGGSGPDSMITYRAVPGHHPLIKGSDLWKPTWEQVKLEDSSLTVFRAELDESLFDHDFPIDGFNPFHQSPSIKVGRDIATYYAPVRPVEADEPLELTRGMLFLDGRPLRQITDVNAFRFASGVFMVRADGRHLLVRLPLDRSPQGLTFEITTREQVFAPRELGKNFIRLQGLRFEHSANGLGTPQMGMVSSSKGRYWIFEDCHFRWAGTAGLDMGEMAWYTPPGRASNPSPSEGALDFDKTVRRCAFTDNGMAGIWSYGGGPHLVEDCVFERNNRRGRWHAEEAGLKCHDISSSVFRNNLFRDNNSWGLWIDVGHHNNRVTQNLFINNLKGGVFIERSAGTTLVDNNICIGTNSFPMYNMSQADGFYNHQASNVTFAHNLSMGNAGFGFRHLMWGANDGSNSFNPHTVKISHNRVVNNIAYANGRGAISLPVDQKFCWDNFSDHNFIWGAAGAPLFELGRGGVDRGELVAWIEKEIVEHQIPPQEALMLHRWKEGRLGPQVGDMRHAGPLVGLPVWRALRGFDTHSVVGAVRLFLAYRDGRIVLHTRRPRKIHGESASYSESGVVVGARPESYGRLADVECTHLPTIRHDYFGADRPGDRPPTVGPIQDLDRIAGGGAPVEIVLWPNASPDRPPGTAMQIKIEPKSIVGDWEKKK